MPNLAMYATKLHMPSYGSRLYQLQLNEDENYQLVKADYYWINYHSIPELNRVLVTNYL